MKPKLLLLFLLALFIKGYSQETPIDLLPNVDIEAIFNLTAKDGSLTGLVLPVVLNWDKEESLLQLEITNMKFDKPVYLFSGVMPFKSVQKIKKEIQFSKEIAKNANPKKSVMSIHNNLLENLQLVGVETGKGKGKMYNLCEPPGAVFKFKITNQELGACLIKLNLYVGNVVKDKKSKTNVIIEKMAVVNMRINLSDPCKNEELLKIIELLDKKTFIITDEAATITSETAELPGVAEKTVKTSKAKPALKDKKINNIADPQFIKYQYCENLIEVVEKYNTAIDAHEKATALYNNLLDDRKKGTSVAPGTSCQFLKTANEKLMNLYYRIEQSSKSNYPALQAEYNKIKDQVEINDKCKEYAAYKEWCKGIEKLLKK